jgi:hypothetical protein
MQRALTRCIVRMIRARRLHCQPSGHPDASIASGRKGKRLRNVWAFREFSREVSDSRQSYGCGEYKNYQAPSFPGGELIILQRGQAVRDNPHSVRTPWTDRINLAIEFETQRARDTGNPKLVRRDNRYLGRGRLRGLGSHKDI